MERTSLLLRQAGSEARGRPRPMNTLQSYLRLPFSQWPAHWPLSVLILGYPLWWLLGIAAFMPIVVAVLMLGQLRRRSPILIPRGGGWWLAFLIWVALGVFVLWSDAPGAVPESGGMGRLLVWLYGFMMYIACTVAMLWIANARKHDIPFTKVSSILSWLFVIATAGGLLGVAFPTLELKSMLEIVLPKQLSSNGFVRSLIHPAVADVQTILGRPEARPKAPFPYANTWGSAISLSVPFFVLSWFRWGGKGKRVAGVLVLALSAIPIVYSLNRGLWACLAVGMVYLMIAQGRRGRIGALAGSVLVLSAAILVFVASPLAGLVGERFENQHSNDRREQLMVQTVQSAVSGSPIVGFGSTRDVQGSFASIAGGATPDCPGCGVPPLGTQGHLWLVIFAQGIVGAFFFVMFFLSALVNAIRGPTMPELVAGAVLIFFLIQIFVYDTLGVPLLVVMLAAGLSFRETVGRRGVVRTVGSLRADLRLRRRWAVTSVALGSIVGLLTSMIAAREYVVYEHVLLTDTPSYLPVELLSRAPRPITIDTEAALVMSQQTLDAIASDPEEQSGVRSRLRVTAIPNTQILVLALRGDSPAGLQDDLKRIGSAYLETRREYLLDRRSQVLSELYSRSAELFALGRSSKSGDVKAVNAAIEDNLLTRTEAGELVRSLPPVAVPREVLKYVGTGAAVGLLLAGVVLGLRRGGAPRGRSRWVF